MFPYVRLHFCSQVQGGFFSFGIFKKSILGYSTLLNLVKVVEDLLGDGCH